METIFITVLALLVILRFILKGPYKFILKRPGFTRVRKQGSGFILNRIFIFGYKTENTWFWLSVLWLFVYFNFPVVNFFVHSLRRLICYDLV